MKLRRVWLSLVLLAVGLWPGLPVGVAARLAQSDVGPRLRLQRAEPQTMLASAAVGAYSVRVSTFNAPVGAQAYALVVAGPLGDAAPPPPAHNRLYLPLVQR